MEDKEGGAEDEFATGPLSLLLHSMRTNSQVLINVRNNHKLLARGRATIRMRNPLKIPTRGRRLLFLAAPYR